MNERAKWPKWKIVLAYAVMIAIASVSIWFVDRGAMRVQQSTTTAHPGAAR